MARELFNNAYFPSVALSQGWIKGAGPRFIQGRAMLGPSDTERVIWSGPTDDYVFPSNSGENMEILSSNAADTQLILIRGLDVNFDDVDIFVTLNGTTPVALPQPLTRANMVIIAVANPAPLGDITLRGAGGGTVYNTVELGRLGSTQAVYTVPRTKNLNFISVYASIDQDSGTNTGVIYTSKFRMPGDLVALSVLDVGLNKQGTSAQYFPIDVGASAGPMTDVIWTAKSTSNNTDLTLLHQCVLYDV